MIEYQNDGNVRAAGVIADNVIVRGDGGARGVQGSTATVDDNGGISLGLGASTTSGRSLTIISSAGAVIGTLDVSGGIMRLLAPSGFHLSGFADGQEVWRATTNLRFGVGATVPQGKLHVLDGAGGFLHKYISGIVGSAISIIPNGTGDVTLVLSGTFTASDGAGNVAGGVITATAPGANFNLYDDGGSNTLQLQVAADGSVTVIRTAGARTYACNLCLNWM